MGPMGQLFTVFICTNSIILTFRHKVKYYISYGAILIANSGFVMHTAEYTGAFSFLTQVFETSIGTVLGMYWIQKFFLEERLELLMQHYEMNQLKQEYHAILENLNEGVITKSSHKGLKYLNTVAFSLLQAGVSLTQD